MRPSGCAIALAIMFFIFVTMGGAGRGMMMGGSWMLSQMLLPLLIFGVILILVRSQPRHTWHERSRAYDLPTPRQSGTPEEILRQRFARGELTRDQYQESIIEILKGRYVTGELTLDEYEDRVGTLIADSPVRRLRSETTREYL